MLYFQWKAPQCAILHSTETLELCRDFVLFDASFIRRGYSYGHFELIFPFVTPMTPQTVPVVLCPQNPHG